MTEQELRELDCWIGVNIFGWIKIDKAPHPTDNRQINGALYSPPGCTHDCGQGSYIKHYTTDRAAAMEVLERCLKTATVEIVSVQGGSIRIMNREKDAGGLCMTFALTLPLAICLFAKKLFGKE